MRATVNKNGFRRAVVVALSAGVVLTAMLFAASPASASTYITSGSPGKSGTERSTGSFNMGWAEIGSGGITAYRSPASTGTQKVTIRWRVWRTYGGTWQLADDVSDTWTVYPGQYVYDPGWVHQSALLYYFSTDVRITWRTSTGAFLGEAYRDYIHFGDYQCLVWNGCAVIWQGGQYSLFMN